MSATAPAPFRLEAPGLPSGWLLLEASAGTGKTYSLTALVARYVAEAGVGMDEVLLVTFTRAAAAELRNTLRAQLSAALAALHDPTTADEPWLARLVDCPDDELARRRARVDGAVTAVDAATITTIHGFFQIALGELGMRAGAVADGEVAPAGSRVTAATVRDHLVRLLSEDPQLLDPTGERTAAQVEEKLLAVVAGLEQNLSARPAPSDPAVGPAHIWAELAAAVRDTVAAQRRAAGTLTFDDLITSLAGLVDDPDLGPDIRRALRSHYRLVLIDEFQDTDNLQWKVFRDTFDPSDHPGLAALVVVGDPKQAIYRFRGADIDAYLGARRDPRMVIEQMTRNFRSDAALIDVLNAWLGGTTFGHPDIPYVPVDTPEAATHRLIEGAGTPVQLRWLPVENDGDKLAADAARARIAVDLVDHVCRLLADGRIVDGTTQRGIDPGDICVLVRGHNEADIVFDALTAHGVPATRSRINRVFETPAAGQLALLLEALAQPSDARRVRALLLTWFVDAPLELATDPEYVAALQARCAEWADRLARRGVHSFFQRFRTEDGVLAAVARDGGLDRNLTDLEHLVELLHAATDGVPVPASGLLARLRDLSADASDADEVKRRIDSDAQAVQITTIHAAKGLEYPVVLLPYPKGPRNEPPFVYTHDGTRHLDASPVVDWTEHGVDAAERKRRAGLEVDGDEQRLLYVALTRARHQLVVWWAHTQGVEKGPLARLLFADPTDPTAPVPKPTDDATRVRLGELPDRLGSGFSVTELPVVGPRPHPAPPVPAPDPADLRCAVLTRAQVADDRVYRWSFSTLTKEVADRATAEADPRGGADEVDDPDGPADGPAAGAAAGALVDLPAGAAFGTFLHAVLERVDFTATPLDAEIRSAVDRTTPPVAALRLGPDDVEPLVAGLAAVVATPLDGLPGGAPLRTVAPTDRLPELQFHFALPTADPFTARALFALADGDPEFGDYFAALARRATDAPVRGLMTGSIDAVLRCTPADRPTFAVVDYKSNRLHAPGAPPPAGAYGRAAMHRAMVEHEYPAQALLYLVALHRYLALRLPGYDVDRDLGPAGYLFVRGMTGPDTPVHDGTRDGVFVWRPASSVVVAASRLLEDAR